LFLLLLLIFPPIIVGAVAMSKGSDAVGAQLLLSSRNSIDTLNESITQYLQLQMEDVAVLADQLNSNGVNKGDAATRALIDRFASAHPELELIILGTETGKWMKSPDPGPQTYDPRERDWYKAILKQKGKVVISDPYVSVTTNNVVVTIGKSFPDGNGAIGINLSLQHMADMVKKTKIGQTGYVYVLDQHQKYLIHPKQKSGDPAKTAYYAEYYKKDSGVLDYLLDGVPKRAAFTTNALTGWKLVGTLPLEETTTSSRGIRTAVIAVTAAGIVVGGLLAALFILSITRPLNRIIATSQLVSRGDLSQRIAVKSDDELGVVAGSFNAMVDSLRSLIVDIGQTSSQLAVSSEQLSASAEQTSHATAHIAASIQEVSLASDNQSRHTEQSERTIVDISGKVAHIAGTIDRLHETSRTAEDKAAAGSETVQAAVGQMATIHATVGGFEQIIGHLHARSAEIGQIIKAITSIAQQTNLLALNAGIEAARAGEHGRGFAVVASEIRKLAEQSSQSAQSIAELIGAIQTDTEGAVHHMASTSREVQTGLDMVQQSGALFAEIARLVEQASEMTGHVTEDAAAIAGGTEQMVQAMGVLSGAAEKNAAGSQNISAAAEQQLASMEEISASATALSRMAEELAIAVEKFKL
jgi:methyl-accepting chemotaxis protein